MALKATVFKVTLNIADLDRHYYDTHKLTIARHPSENDERMIMRLVAFALNASNTLSFTRGLCVDDEPELWVQEDNGDISLWIELGQPDEKRLKKACKRARQVIVYSYHARSAPVWWQQISNKISRYPNLRVCHIAQADNSALSDLVQRSMTLQCNIQDKTIWLSNGDTDVSLNLETWQKGFE